MKKTILILFSVCIVFVSFGQEDNSSQKIKRSFYEFFFNSAFISNTAKIDKYFSNIYEDYNKTFIPTVGVGFNYGFNIISKLSLGIGGSFSTGVSMSDLKKANKQQYKKLDSYIISLGIEYCFLDKDYFNLFIKSGFGADYTTFRYNRQAPLDITSYSYINGFIPINFTWGIYSKNKTAGAGVFLQYNVCVIKGKPTYSGLDIQPKNIPFVAQNNLEFGVKYRF
ncbi:MAG: hypothetical protein LBV69_11590 [Bacteroidales bacterium]|jgi:hypothetical protein|nr:hypothetical protein [Bacteroidales bacterium]